MERIPAQKLVESLLVGWTWNSECRTMVSPANPKVRAVYVHVNYMMNEAEIRRRCAEGLKLYNKRLATVAASKPTADWSFTASVSNPPHLGRILKEAREHGVKILRVRCGAASRVFVERELAKGADVWGSGICVDDAGGPGVVTREEIWMSGALNGGWLQVMAQAFEASVIAVCQRHLVERREVKVEVLG